jgi:hypothetical protein
MRRRDKPILGRAQHSRAIEHARGGQFAQSRRQFLVDEPDMAEEHVKRQKGAARVNASGTSGPRFLGASDFSLPAGTGTRIIEGLIKEGRRSGRAYSPGH